MLITFIILNPNLPLDLNLLGIGVFGSLIDGLILMGYLDNKTNGKISDAIGDNLVVNYVSTKKNQYCPKLEFYKDK